MKVNAIMYASELKFKIPESFQRIFIYIRSMKFEDPIDYNWVSDVLQLELAMTRSKRTSISV